MVATSLVVGSAPLRYARITAVVLVLLCMASRSSSEVILSLTSGQLSFPSLQASFGPRLSPQGFTGMLSIASPPHGCAPLEPAYHNVTQIALIERGGTPSCAFDEKVRRAQKAGYSAAIIYDNTEENLVVMGGKLDVSIPSVFVAHSSGQVLRKHGGNAVLLLPEDHPQWPSFLVTFIVIICSAVFFATVFTVYHSRNRRRAIVSANQTMSSSEVNRLPTRKFKSGDEEGSCCICLEDFKPGDTLTVLQCKHEFHKGCITPWLRERRRVCPLCKRDPAASERTALLGSGQQTSYSTDTPAVETAAGPNTPAPSSTDTPSAAATVPSAVDASVDGRVHGAGNAHAYTAHSTNTPQGAFDEEEDDEDDERAELLSATSRQ